MDITLRIPKEFESHFEDDRFSDSLGRVMFDLKEYKSMSKLSGRYEMETLGMLKAALGESKESKVAEKEMDAEKRAALMETLREIHGYLIDELPIDVNVDEIMAPIEEALGITTNDYMEYPPEEPEK